MIMTPTDDVTGSNPEARVDGAYFPSTLQTVGRREDVAGPRDQLVLVPGQFRDRADTTNGAGVQRLFTVGVRARVLRPAGQRRRDSRRRSNRRRAPSSAGRWC